MPRGTSNRVSNSSNKQKNSKTEVINFDVIDLQILSFFVAENSFCLDGRRLIEIKKRRQRLLPLNLLPIGIHRFGSTFTKRGAAHYCAYQSSLLIFGHLLHFILLPPPSSFRPHPGIGKPRVVKGKQSLHFSKKSCAFS